MKYKFTATGFPVLDKRIDNARALLDLLNEHYKTNVIMQFTYARAGWGDCTRKLFTIPFFALQRGDDYTSYYVIHEFTHCLGYMGHDKLFKRHEKETLALFDLSVEYARAYPTKIYARGEMVYKRV